MDKEIKLFDPVSGKEEESATILVLRSHFWASGSGIGKVSEFENKFKTYVGSKGCVAVNNGTSALHLALSLFDIKNKEVILPSLSFVSTAHAIIYNGGIPRFVDIDSSSLCIDPSLIKKNITKKTAVILPVHFGGMPANLDEISSLCKEHDIKLVEDAAHACGASFNDKKIGSHGNAVCFSFHPVKNLAMPGGGAITLNDHVEKSSILHARRWCGITNRKGTKYDVKHLGWNFYMNEISAAVGIEQLKKLDKMNLKRKKIAKRYSQEMCLENKMPFNSDCSYHLYWIQVKNRNNFIKKMKDNKIETGIHYYPIHKMSFYNDSVKLPITENIAKHIVSIPIHPNLDESNVDKIIKCTNNFS